MKSGNGLALAINEVATRDGFQMECDFIATDDKVALIDELNERFPLAPDAPYG